VLHSPPGYKPTTHFEYVGDAAVFAEGVHLGFTYVPKNSRITTDWKELGFRTGRSRVSGELKTGIHMPELRNNASSHDSQPTGLASHDRNRGAELAAQADVMLARYPTYIREQITELLRVLAAKPGEAENGVQ
jgi:hypothetical protein